MWIKNSFINLGNLKHVVAKRGRGGVKGGGGFQNETRQRVAKIDRTVDDAMLFDYATLQMSVYI